MFPNFPLPFPLLTLPSHHRRWCFYRVVIYFLVDLIFSLENLQDNNASNPKYSYLKLNDNTRVPRRRGDLPNDNNNNSSTDSHNMTVIVKTLVISALTCLGSILSLFFISFTIYRYSLNKNRGVFSCARRGSREEVICFDNLQSLK